MEIGGKNLSSIDTKLFGKDFLLYKKSLDVFLERHLIILSNIANVDTPGYKAKELRFEDYLKSLVEPHEPKLELRRTNKAHLPSPYPRPPKPEVFYEMGAFGYDKNSVDIDTEMMKMSENAFRYRVSTEFISGKFRKIQDMLERVRP